MHQTETAALGPSGPIRHTDRGIGDPVILVHGSSRTGRFWATRIGSHLRRGHRVITCERRYPSAAGDGCDYEGFASDLHALLVALDVRGAILVGFAMGPSQIIKYLAAHGVDRVRQAIMFAPVRPFVVEDTEDRAEEIFAEIVRGIAADRPAFLRSFIDDFYDMDVRWPKST